MKGHFLEPFVELKFGESHLNSKVQQVPLTEVSASGTDFSWLLGGGADYQLNPHWNARFKLDFLRTHFADAGQSRLRLAVQIVYNFGER
jgi:opacity protein-like surface antigen